MVLRLFIERYDNADTNFIPQPDQPRFCITFKLIVSETPASIMIEIPLLPVDKE
jgi:hypothetical protein